MNKALIAVLAAVFLMSQGVAGVAPQPNIEIKPPGIEKAQPVQDDDSWDCGYGGTPQWVETGLETEVDKPEVPVEGPNTHVCVTVLWWAVPDHEEHCHMWYNDCHCSSCMDYCCEAPGYVMYSVEFRSETPLGVVFYKQIGMIDQRIAREGYGQEEWSTTNEWSCRGKKGVTECPYEAIRSIVEEQLGFEVNEIEILWRGVDEDGY